MNDVRVVGLESVIAMTGISRATIFRMRKAGQFPQPARLGSRALRFWLADIEAWLVARRAEGASQ
ncbi:helix-turn-helix transcriptional regulator [Paraburkholderia diazotrophica]|uniref:Transcriptional regulator, AlpA family n=1 Tax=Paraburkholderia diazotrophica TaxID=667676 RepID=A0A1H6TZH7_9BURK|nr:AlpA family phage regulatory protein [Paraburkholderia diazotrophica]SEI81630.1 transcriptional regulator, AlpA family [Paraburkholderia diazotrophica]